MRDTTLPHWFEGKHCKVPMRDNQKNKLYRAENSAFASEKNDKIGDGSIEAATRYAETIVASETWMRLRKQHHQLRADGTCWIRQHGIEVKSKSHGSALGGGCGIALPPWACTKVVVLHELAHCLVGGGMGHNWPFARAFADLCGMFLGDDARKRLHAAYKVHRVKHRAPRIMSEAAKRALAERGRKALQLYTKEAAGEAQ